MEYKVGDKVRIKSVDWYNENKDADGFVRCGDRVFDNYMSEFCGSIVTIVGIYPHTGYDIQEDMCCCRTWTNEMIEGLVERNGKTYPYKIGDRVVLKGNNRCATITDLKYNSWGNLSYYIKIDNDKDISIDYPTELLLPYDNMIEGLVEKKTSIKLTGKATKNNEMVVSVDEYILPEGYIFKDENGNVINATKIVLEKKSKYPKTYEKCCKVLNRSSNIVPEIRMVSPEESLLFSKLIRLKRCRDAYWNIAGEEMGLDKPWEPDYKNPDIDLYVIINIYNRAEKAKYGYGFQHCVLTFPTAEMRDAFYENFKKEIEFCKELL